MGSYNGGSVVEGAMSPSLEQFCQQLTESRLLAPAEVDSFLGGLPKDRKPEDAEALARELVAAKRITKYQAQAVYQGKGRQLVFGEYVVLDRIGQGGMGVVLKAEHRRMKRLVAVKTISAAAMKSPEAVQRFYREVEMAAKLSHPNIVAAYDAGEHDGLHYLVMEYVDGKDLATVLKDRGPLPLAEALNYTQQAARGLQYAHEEGVIHRDIKPGNLLLDRKGVVKILDMGLARATGSETALGGPERLTTAGQVMGTCDYMAPEQALDTRLADHRADIYSLGCTFYRLLTGEALYRRETLMQTLLAHRDEPVPSLREACNDVTLALEAVFYRMVAKRPEDRQQSMAQVVAESENVHGESKSEFARLGRREPEAPPLPDAALGVPPVSRTVALAAPLQIGRQETLTSAVQGDTDPATQGHAGKLLGWQKLVVGGGVLAALLMVLATYRMGIGGRDEDRQTAVQAEIAAQGEAIANPVPEPAVLEAAPATSAQPVGPAANEVTASANILSESELAAGWRLLFDGSTTRGWVGVEGKEVPRDCTVAEGQLCLRGGRYTIFTQEAFDNFELLIQWRVSPHGNGGVFYRVPSASLVASPACPEYQMADSADLPFGTGTPGALFDLYEAPRSLARPLGEWNDTRLVVVGRHVEHWLNGTKTVDCELNSPDFFHRLRNSNVGRKKDFQCPPFGRLGLQGWTGTIWYRNIKLRPLPVDNRGKQPKQRD